MATTSDTLSLLLRAILDAPDDDGPRLAYSDALEESGEVGRAEFIRVQIELAARFGVPKDGGPVVTGDPAADAEERQLRSRQRATLESAAANGRPFREWLGEGLCAAVPDGALWWDHIECRRGFVERVTLSADAWVAHGDAILAAQPVTEVVLTTRPDYVRVHDDDRNYGEWSSWYTLRRPRTARGIHVLRRGSEPNVVGDVIRRLLKAEWLRVKTWTLPGD